MPKRIIITIILALLLFSCSKKEEVVKVEFNKNKAFEVYKEGIEAMQKNDFFYATKKFDEAELLFEKMENSAKALILSSYSFYRINFYNESQDRLNRFKIKYIADPNLQYAYYLSAVISFEQILDEKKDLKPLIQTKKRILEYLDMFPETEYALDLTFKLDLVSNQLAAKEMYVAKYYIEKKKWVPAINRLKKIVEIYDETVFVEEALHRLVEIYYEIGLKDEAQSAAKILGYNYNSSEWYARSYKVLNKDYKITFKPKKEKNTGLIMRTIKKITK